jgi:hypothetical protein
VEIILSKPVGLDLEWTNGDALNLHLFFILLSKKDDCKDFKDCNG